MRIGIDLDNTIIFYDDAFVSAAQERGLLAPGFTGNKRQVREAIRRLPEGETQWMALQGYVYGKGLPLASLFPGLTDCLAACKARGDALFIVSHKTEFGHFDPDKVNLRGAALQWLEVRGFFAGQGFLPPSQVFFAPTRTEKVEKIASLALDWFIDDLPEVYEEASFPTHTRKILFHTGLPQGDWLCCKNWQEIRQALGA